MWVGETIADVVNYPLAGLFVVFLAASLPLAFWFDAVTYLASAVLLATIVVPPIVRKATRRGRRVGRADSTRGEPGRADPHGSSPTSRRAGRSSATRRSSSRTRSRAPRRSSRSASSRSRLRHREGDHDRAGDEYRATYAFMETAIGLGKLIGGFVLGLVATRVAKGRLIIAAYTAFGALVILVGSTHPGLMCSG